MQGGGSMSKKSQKHSKSQLVNIGPEGMLPALCFVFIFTAIIAAVIAWNYNFQDSSEKISIDAVVKLNDENIAARLDLRYLLSQSAEISGKDYIPPSP